MTYLPTRRAFLKKSPLLIAMLSAVPVLATGLKAKKTIILRSSWQTVNIGDIAHTPGVLTLLEDYFPQADILLWPSDVGDGVEQMIMHRFPKLIILKTEQQKESAIKEADFFLHGSAPSLTGRKELERWIKASEKPYGIYGITYPGVYGFEEDREKFNPEDIELLTKAQFAYFRDSVSLEFARKIGVKCPIMEFCPDGAFAVDVKDDQAAISFLKTHDLADGKFMCVIPQFRFSPWWEIPAKKLMINEKKNDYNMKMKEHDNAPIREAIIAVVRQTDLKILIVPENETQVHIGKEMLYDPLPEDVKKRVVWRDHYWLTDEAVSTYARSAGLFGLEMHSPIMCIALGIPAVVCRFEEQTSKAAMWKDIGLQKWLFDMDTPKDVAGIVPAVLDIAKNPKSAKAQVVKAQQFVKKRQQQTMAVLKEKLYAKS
ncbi:polysaccharide pyruvyl transferase family protein [Dyadobacter psychrotolerans]|uniref:Polysaccharide pyruvyl transferase family protein n=1 Tax=Dyadobacter psychrotolerans TaxID=2541721 RepID=A0A4R5DKY1_9BACT|nr:polysaccharide pyruvyl transferase family protein [Dyadobacter psychrotolerans]TDE14856.1 polysaccharide pyruvyl transferase family protein [Dyadobacter psychrotolerans]